MTKIPEMRAYVEAHYNGIYNNMPVGRMPDKQIVAIYLSLKTRENKPNSRKTCCVVIPQQEIKKEQLFVNTDSGYVVDTTTDELFTKEEFEQMYVTLDVLK